MEIAGPPGRFPVTLRPASRQLGEAEKHGAFGFAGERQARCDSFGSVQRRWIPNSDHQRGRVRVWGGMILPEALRVMSALYRQGELPTGDVEIRHFTLFKVELLNPRRILRSLEQRSFVRRTFTERAGGLRGRPASRWGLTAKGITELMYAMRAYAEIVNP